MKIYVSHSKSFDFKNELYRPLIDSELSVEFIFPHIMNEIPFNSKELFKEKGCDYVLAEVSHPATGQGIELGWADIFGIPIIAMYKTGARPAGSLKVITDKIVDYSDKNDLVNKLTVELGLNIA